MDLLKINVDGCFAASIGEDHGVSQKQWSDILPSVVVAQQSLLRKRDSGELGFPDLPFIDDAIIEEITDTALAVQQQFDDLIILGIGGSSLGLRTILEGVFTPAGRRAAFVSEKKTPRLHIFDNVDPESITPVLQTVKWNLTAVIVISKSGRTAETAAQFLIMRDLLERELGSRWKEHLFVITDPESGILRKVVEEDGLANFSVPANVGGRFSCLSPVGLFPAACAGVNIVELLDGARDMAKQCLQKQIYENPAAGLAAMLYLLDVERGKNIQVLMPYLDGLRRMSDWYVQLVAESLGKNGKGPTPLPALGATDQHAQVQLFMEGPNNKVVTMITAEHFNSELKIPKTDIEELQYLSGHDLGDLLNAEARATASALQENSRPVINITIPMLDAHSIGQLIFLFEWSTALSGNLYGVDAFNQPGVERGKILTKEFLANS